MNDEWFNSLIITTMNTKIQTRNVQDFSRNPDRMSSGSVDHPCYLERYSRYDLEWIQFLVDSRKLKDGTHENPCEPELLPNVWNTPQH